MYYLTSKHYLHKAYTKGYWAKDDNCPYCNSTREWEWWWAGWGDGIPKRK